jgi:hypothetical protein
MEREPEGRTDGGGRAKKIHNHSLLRLHSVRLDLRCLHSAVSCMVQLQHLIELHHWLWQQEGDIYLYTGIKNFTHIHQLRSNHVDPQQAKSETLS